VLYKLIIILYIHSTVVILYMQEVQGELIDVDDQMLKVLDKLEEHPRIYHRTPVQCVLEEGTSTDLPGLTGNIACETYLVYNFHPELLSLPHLSSYTDRSDMHYVSKIDRARGF
jgi:gamma-glutamylcyclotransferase (GGCT)/AIG2-like uncharacterized protein YtfP